MKKKYERSKINLDKIYEDYIKTEDLISKHKLIIELSKNYLEDIDSFEKLQENYLKKRGFLSFLKGELERATNDTNEVLYFAQREVIKLKEEQKKRRVRNLISHLHVAIAYRYAVDAGEYQFYCEEDYKKAVNKHLPNAGKNAYKPLRNAYKDLPAKGINFISRVKQGLFKKEDKNIVIHILQEMKFTTAEEKFTNDIINYKEGI